MVVEEVNDKAKTRAALRRKVPKRWGVGRRLDKDNAVVELHHPAPPTKLMEFPEVVSEANAVGVLHGHDVQAFAEFLAHVALMKLPNRSPNVSYKDNADEILMGLIARHDQCVGNHMERKLHRQVWRRRRFLQRKRWTSRVVDDCGELKPWWRTNAFATPPRTGYFLDSMGFNETSTECRLHILHDHLAGVCERGREDRGTFVNEMLQLRFDVESLVQGGRGFSIRPGQLKDVFSKPKHGKAAGLDGVCSNLLLSIDDDTVDALQGIR